MTPQEFAAKWAASKLGERAGSQSHFLDLCRLLREPTPAEVDPDGAFFTFEKGALKTGGRKGWADVWKRGCFAWEYKGKHHDLDDALGQLLRYGAALENPPLLIVSDMDTIRIHTNFTNTVQQVHAITLDDIAVPEQLRKLHWAFSEPERLKPGVTRESITEDAARTFAAVAQRLRARGHDPMRVAHFVNRMLFCLFAEDIKLLPERLFQRMLEASLPAPERFQGMAQELFGALADEGGRIGFTAVPWFNGGLFDGDDALPLERADVQDVLDAAALDWSAIEPSIFGTLFERGLDPDKRSQLGAHYTDGTSIDRVIEPAVLRPLAGEWRAVKAEMSALTDLASAKSGAAKTNLQKRRRALYHAFRDRLAAFRILDPACGSGNFLYLALRGLKDLEHRVIYEAETLGEPPDDPRIGPQSVMGIEINPYAAELARVSIWIGEIQWQLRHSYGYRKSPVLRTLERIECRDAVLNADGSEAEWPAADVIVGNPPFLGGNSMIGVMGEAQTERIRRRFDGRLPGGVDLVAYWFEKARAMLEAGRAGRAGFVSTQSIRAGSNRRVLERIVEGQRIFDAWSDEPWIVDGASVRVSIVCFCRPDDPAATLPVLDGKPVAAIHANLTAGEVDVTSAKPLPENAKLCFQGTSKVGDFEVDGETARKWLVSPNAHGRPNSDVVKPWANGSDVTGRRSDRWIVDFGTTMSEAQAALYELPFAHVERLVRPAREAQRRELYARYWWRHAEARPGLRRAIAGLSRYIATPRVAKHRTFVWMPSVVVPDTRLNVIARDDDVSFGILQSRFHEAWSLAACSWHGKGNDPTYNGVSCFQTFAFPDGTAPGSKPEALGKRSAAIAEAARNLVGLREGWLNPAELTLVEPEVVPGFPDRILPRNAAAKAELAKRTVTELYNVRPRWLADAHAKLDAAVAAAYGWPADLPNEAVLRRLLDMNDLRAPRSR